MYQNRESQLLMPQL